MGRVFGASGDIAVGAAAIAPSAQGFVVNLTTGTRTDLSSPSAPNSLATTVAPDGVIAGHADDASGDVQAVVWVPRH
jgi:hypothetical protein